MPCTLAALSGGGYTSGTLDAYAQRDELRWPDAGQDEVAPAISTCFFVVTAIQIVDVVINWKKKKTVQKNFRSNYLIHLRV